MNDKTENKEPKKTVGTNSLQLPFPQDPQGALMDVKKGGIASAGRINGDRVKLDKFLETLRVLQQYSIECFKRDVEARKVTKENAVSASLRIAKRQRDAANARAQELENMAKELRAKAGINDEPEDKTAGAE